MVVREGDHILGRKEDVGLVTVAGARDGESI
jgi:hypothetical protein